MRVLITGGAGFVGRHFTSHLVKAGHDVTVVDPLTEGSGALPLDSWPDFLGVKAVDFTFIEEDCRSFFSFFDRVHSSFDLVVHLAAVVGGRLTIERQALAVADDLSIDARFFQWAAQTRPKSTMYFSSSAAYPIGLQTRDKQVVLSEDMISFEDAVGVPDLSYGWAKLTGEFLSALAVERYGLDVKIFRPFSGYGEDQDLTYPFPAIVQRAMAHREGDPFIVWGSGEQQRDFVHIDDCVQMSLAACDILGPGEALNLSSGEGATFADLAAFVFEILGRPSPRIECDRDKPEGVFYRVGSVEKQRSLGLRPSTSLAEGVRRAIQHFEAGR
jgi:nucleoside-diphosphate-sugar epimerase